MNKSCETLLKEYGWTHKWHSPMDPSHRRESVGRPARTYIHLLCMDTGCSLEDLPEEMDDRDEWQESVCNMMMMIVYILVHVCCVQLIEGCPRGVMVKAMECGIVVSDFILQSHYYDHFQANTLGKGMNPLILPAMG